MNAEDGPYICGRSFQAIIRRLLVDKMIRSAGRETFGAVVEARRLGGVHLTVLVGEVETLKFYTHVDMIIRLDARHLVITMVG